MFTLPHPPDILLFKIMPLSILLAGSIDRISNMAVNVQVSQTNNMQLKGQQNSMPDRSLRSVFGKEHGWYILLVFVAMFVLVIPLVTKI